MRYIGNPALSDQGEQLLGRLRQAWGTSLVPGREPRLAEFLYSDERRILNHAAFFAENHGVSHRKINTIQVGAVAVGFTKFGELEIAEGANWSPYRGAPKYCAEINALAMATDRLIHSIFGIYVVGPDDQRLNLEINGLDAPTLHPCAQPCRKALYDHSATTSDTLLVMRRIGTDITERMTLDELSDQYRAIAPPATTGQLLQS